MSLGKLKEMQNGGKRARRGIDQWDRVSLGIGSAYGGSTNSYAAKYDRFTMTLCDAICLRDPSDGARPPVDRLHARTDRQADCSGRLRAQQPMEGAYRHSRAVEEGTNDCSANNDSCEQHAILSHSDTGPSYSV